MPFPRHKTVVGLLAGGRSRRFGRDKARAELHGEPLLAHVLRRIAPRASRVTLVARDRERYADLGAPVVTDRRPGGLGPLAGLEAALLDLGERGDGPWLLLTGCDFVGFRRGWVDRLLAARGPAAQAVLFRGVRWQPIFALYHEALLPLVGRLLDAGQRDLRGLPRAARAVAVPEPPGWRDAVNVNAPTDLVRAACTAPTD